MAVSEETLVPEINFRITTPEQRTRQEWRNIFGLAHSAMLDVVTSPESPEEVRQLQLPRRFFETHKDPNLLVGNEVHANQAYRNPHVVTAHKEGQTVGYLYTAENVLGSGLERAMKWHMPRKTYIWAWEVAVSPDVREQDIATTMTLIDLKNRDMRNKVTTYIWPDLMEKLHSSLVERSFIKTDSPDVDQIRLESSVGMLKRRLLPKQEVRRAKIRQGMIGVDNTLDI